jgi:hypothetical protein
MADPSEDAKPTRPNGLIVRGSKEWREWLGRLAEHDRTTMADLIDRAVVDYARKVGFGEGAPRR